VFACLARLNKEPLFPKEVLFKPMRIRVVFEITGRLFYMLAISLTPLFAATVILQAIPVVVVAGLQWFLGKRLVCEDGLRFLLVF